MSNKDELRQLRLRRRITMMGGVLALGAVTTTVISVRAPSAVPSAANQPHAKASIAVPFRKPQAVQPPQTTIETSHASGSILGIGWRTATFTVTAGGSVATATAVGVGAAGQAPDTVNALCFDLMTSHAQQGSGPRDPTLTISTTNDVTATVQVRGPGDSPLQTIAVVLATCPGSSPQ